MVSLSPLSLEQRQEINFFNSYKKGRSLIPRNSSDFRASFRVHRTREEAAATIPPPFLFPGEGKYIAPKVKDDEGPGRLC